ncbi:MAG TPA: SMP-30/gluconolactonase/LRE family protein [Streptosporangiaceae bacterium]|jgi:gluconolactonase
MRMRRLAEGLAWPEGPVVLPGERIAFVETYRSQVSVYETGRPVRRLAYTGGGPNAAVTGPDGAVYVTQNGGVVGPWRAEDTRAPSIQRIDATGAVEELVTDVGGIKLGAPNDLVFGADGRLYFTDPGGPFDPEHRPDPGRVLAVALDGAGEVIAELPPVYPNGIAAQPDGGIVWAESYPRALQRRRPDGTVTEVHRFADEAAVPDGFKIAPDGRYYVATVTSGGVHILTPDGDLAGFIPVGMTPTNCAIDGSALIVTDGGRPGDTQAASAGGVLWLIEDLVTEDTG